MDDTVDAARYMREDNIVDALSEKGRSFVNVRVVLERVELRAQRRCIPTLVLYRRRLTLFPSVL